MYVTLSSLVDLITFTNMLSTVSCVIWDASNSNWTTEGCTTSAANSGVTCSCDKASGAFAVTSGLASRAQTGDDDNGGLSTAIIGVIAGVGGVALIAVIVGSVIGVKRHRARQAGAAGPVPGAAPGAAPAPSALSSDSVAVPVAAAGVAGGPGTPSSVAGSYSSSSSRSIVSSSSSEEEIMEQQIKDIVGELSTALPRDPRALEVLGDRLDME